MLTTVSPASAVAAGASGGGLPGGGGTPPGGGGGGHKRMRGSGASPDEDADDNNLLSFDSPAPVRRSPNTFVSYNSLTLRLRRIGEEKEEGLWEDLGWVYPAVRDTVRIPSPSLLISYLRVFIVVEAGDPNRSIE